MSEMAETREVLYRGPAKGGLQHQGTVYYPGDLMNLSDVELGALMRTSGHVFQWPDGDIVRRSELGIQSAQAQDPRSGPAAAERRARLAEAQTRAHRIPETTDPVDTATENQVIASGGDPDKMPDPVTGDALTTPEGAGRGRTTKKD